MNSNSPMAISVGMKVRTLDGHALGSVARIHGETFEIESGLLLKQDHAVAMSEVLRIDGEGVVLSVDRASFEAMRAAGGVGTALRDRASGVVDHTKAAVLEAIHAPSSRAPKVDG